MNARPQRITDDVGTCTSRSFPSFPRPERRMAVEWGRRTPRGVTRASTRQESDPELSQTPDVRGMSVSIGVRAM